jgi:hypothetical protein
MEPISEMWQWKQGNHESDLMCEADARYWAQRQNNRTSSIGNEAKVRRVLVGEWVEQDNYDDYAVRHRDLNPAQ